MHEDAAMSPASGDTCGTASTRSGGSEPTRRTEPVDASEVSQVEGLLQRVASIQQDHADSPIHSYEDLVHLMRTCDLKPFTRAGPLEAIYAGQFLPAVKAEYGSTADFLLKRLDWTTETVQEARGSGQYFTRRIDKRYVRVRKNDWAYSVPKDYEHWLVWTLLPLVNWPQSAPFVQDRGLSGRHCPQHPELDMEAESNHTKGVCGEIVAFAKQEWSDATDFMWLVNPVKLQSVPALVGPQLIGVVKRSWTDA